MIYEYFKSIRKFTAHLPYHQHSNVHTFPKNNPPLVLGHVPSANVPPKVTDISVAERNRAAHLKISNEEYQRRDKLVRAAAASVTFHVGDTCYPINKEAYEKYGPCMIQFVARRYLDMGPSDSWPEHDNPMVLTFSPLSNRQKRINCTNNYVSKTNIHLEIPQC